MADTLGVGPTTVRRALADLRTEGSIVMDPPDQDRSGRAIRYRIQPARSTPDQAGPAAGAAAELWARTCTIIESTDPDAYRAWIQSVRCVGMDAEALHLTATAFISQWVSTHYSDLILTGLETAMGGRSIGRIKWV